MKVWGESFKLPVGQDSQGREDCGIGHPCEVGGGGVVEMSKDRLREVEGVSRKPLSVSSRGTGKLDWKWVGRGSGSEADGDWAAPWWRSTRPLAPGSLLLPGVLCPEIS